MGRLLCLNCGARALCLVALLIILPADANGRAEYACKSLLFPFCDISLPVEDRVKDLVSRLDVREKIELLGSSAVGIPRLGIPQYEWWQEALHGVAECIGVSFGGPIKAATSFPQPILTAASFNDSLFYDIGQVISTEARAFYNEGQSGLTFWAPNINIYRDPRWGRGQETPGEDPLLASNYALQFVKAMEGQTQHGSITKLKTSTTCKHFSAYDLEKWGDADRNWFDAIVTMQDLEDTFNPPFRSCVQDGKASGLMCSYNRVNGVPSCGSYSLLTETARDKWGFDGYIVSDCDAVYDMIINPSYSNSLEDAVADSLAAGMDLDCGITIRDHGAIALTQGMMKESDLDRALYHLFKVQMRLGLFDGNPDNQVYGDLGVDDVCTEEHQALALEAALQGIVLLKNDDDTLPLSQDQTQSLAVVGPSATDADYRMLGNYAGIPCKYITPEQGLGHYSNIHWQPGCLSPSCEESDFTDAESAGAEADAVIILAGLSQVQEEEGLDRTSLRLPGHQEELITSVAKAAKGPVVLVIMSGGPVDISFAKEDRLISSIIWIGYPGQAGGQALAEIIFGDRNPGGKLPITWYPEPFTQVPMTTMNMRPDSSTGYPGRTYRFYTEVPVFTFGYGLSYTTFKNTFMSAPSMISIPSLQQQFCDQKQRLANGDLSQCTQEDSTICNSLSFDIEVVVRNVGSRSGSEVVMLYAVPPGSGTDGMALKTLVAYQRVFLEAGSHKRLIFHLQPCKDLSTVKMNGERSLDAGKHILSLDHDTHHLLLFLNDEIQSVGHSRE